VEEPCGEAEEVSEVSEMAPTLEMRPYLRICNYCRIKAYNEKDLDLFVKDKDAKYGRINECKNCRNLRTRKNPPPDGSLRTCGKCGLKAWRIDELELFVFDKKFPYEHRPICKKCRNENRKGKRRTKKELKIISNFPKPIICSVCKEPITKLNGKESDSLHVHSIDGNHENWNPKNKTPMHHKCHISFHNSGNKNYGWKGGISKDMKTYHREWKKRRKKHENSNNNSSQK